MLFKLSTTIGISLAFVISSVSAHGLLKAIDVAGTRYEAYRVGQDDFVTPTPIRFTRRTPDNGPVKDFTGPDITCNRGGNIPNAGIIDIRAGDNVRFVWDWGSSHPGPVITYVAKCTPDCANFKGDTGAVWIKIEQSGWDANVNPKWASERVTAQGGNWVVNIPAALPNGEYLLRHEILGLHGGYEPMGAQFYPHCSHIRINGGGASTPSGAIALPGAYNPEDPGILFSIYSWGNRPVNYTAPGGPVWSGANLQLGGVGAVPAVTRTVSTWIQSPTGVTSSSTVSKPTTTSTAVALSSTSTSSLVSTTAAAPSATAPSTGGTAAAWAQCGGNGYSGPTACVSGYSCTKYNDFYAQCTPA